MKATELSVGTAHDKIPADFQKALLAANPAVVALWQDITPLARNEWICWLEEPKKQETKDRRVVVGISKLSAGERRPCCWAGCIHRTDKAMSPSQKWVYGKK